MHSAGALLYQKIFILGNKVAGLVSGNRTPPWNLVLSFEHEVRRSVYRWVRDGESVTFFEYLEKIVLYCYKKNNN